MFGFVTVVVTSFVGSLSIVAWFVKSLLYVFSGNESTIPANTTSTLPSAGTSTWIPFFKFCSVYTVPRFPTFICVLLSNVNPSGNVSLNVTVFAKFPLFVILTVYVTFSPSVASSLSTIFSLLIIALNIVLSNSSVVSSLVFSGVSNLILAFTLFVILSRLMSKPVYTTFMFLVIFTEPFPL